MDKFDLNFYKGKKVFVTGHTGFKGSWLCKILANAGAIVTGYSLNPPTSPSLFEIANIEQDIHSVAANAVVTKSYTEKDVILGGIPAKVIGKNPDWSMQEFADKIIYLGREDSE